MKIKMKDVTIIKKYKGGFRMVINTDNEMFYLVDKNNNCLIEGGDIDYLKSKADDAIKHCKNYTKYSPLLVGKSIVTRIYCDSKYKNYLGDWVIGKIIGISTYDITGPYAVKFKMKNKIYYASPSNAHLDTKKETLDKLSILYNEIEQKERKVTRLFNKSFGETVYEYFNNKEDNK